MASDFFPHRAGYSFLSIVRTIWKNWASALIIFLLVSAVTCGIVYQVPSIYKADALILVESQKIPEQLVASTVNAELQDRVATISQEILSAGRLESLMDKFNLYRDKRKSETQEEIIDQMRQDIKIKLERGWSRNQPGAFHVSYFGENPETVAAVANELANFFIEQNLKTREEQASGTSEFLKAQLDEANKSLEEQEAKVSKYKINHPGELPEQENSLLAAQASLRIQWQGNQDAISRAEERKLLAATTLAAVESAVAAMKSDARSRRTDRGTPNGTIAAFGEKKSKESDLLRAKLDSLTNRYRDSFPDVQEARRALEKALQREAADVPASPVGEVQPNRSHDSNEAPLAATPELRQEEDRVASLRAQVAAAEKEIQDRQADKRKIEAEMASYQTRLNSLPVREQEMATLVRDYQTSKAHYDQLRQKENSADMATDMEKRQRAERFTILDAARSPEKPFKPNRRLLYPLGMLTGFVLGIGGAFAREMRRNVVLGEWELSPDVVVLGRVRLM